MAKPTEKPDWVGTIETPSGSKKTAGWFKDERPPFQFFNWFWKLVSEWIDWLDEMLAVEHRDDGEHYVRGRAKAVPLLGYNMGFSYVDRKVLKKTLAGGENLVRAICYDGTSIWIALETTPAKIVKMNPVDGSYTTYTLASGENLAHDICFDGTSIWIALFTTPAKIIKMDPSDGTYVTYTLSAGKNEADCICYDGTSIWIGLWLQPAQIIKMDPSDGSYVTYTLDTPDDADEADSILYDGTSIWIVCSNSTDFEVIKMNPSDGTYAYTSGAVGRGGSLCFDGTYIYSINMAGSPAQLEKIDPLTNAIVSEIDLPTGANIGRSLCFDGIYIWAGCNTSPAQIVRVDPSDFTTAACKVFTFAAGENTAQALCFDGMSIWIGFYLSAGRVIRRLPVI